MVTNDGNVSLFTYGADDYLVVNGGGTYAPIMTVRVKDKRKSTSISWRIRTAYFLCKRSNTNVPIIFCENVLMRLNSERSESWCINEGCDKHRGVKNIPNN